MTIAAKALLDLHQLAFDLHSRIDPIAKLICLTCSNLCHDEQRSAPRCAFLAQLVGFLGKHRAHRHQKAFLGGVFYIVLISGLIRISQQETITMRSRRIRPGRGDLPIALDAADGVFLRDIAFGKTVIHAGVKTIYIRLLKIEYFFGKGAIVLRLHRLWQSCQRKTNECCGNPCKFHCLVFPIPNADAAT